MEQPDTSITERWQKILSGDTQEYAAIVDQYKNLVTSIAYSCTGDLTGSEDIAQETFLVAWQSRHEVREPEKLAGWLSSISRNLARRWVRKRSARSWPSTQEEVGDVIQLAPHPSEKIVSEEEQELVWRSLEAIPESYREVMVLFYRESHSIAEVASALEITEEATRQRLSRGRGLLRAEVERTIEHTLTNSRPTARFTSGVMALITMGVGSSVANATTTAAVSAAASTATTGMISKTLAQGAAVAATTGAIIGTAGAVTGILGGLAIGGTLAEGGKAISWKYAVGGSALAPEANTEAARVACRESWGSPFVGTELFLKDKKRFIINQLVYSLAIPVIVSLLLGGFSLAMYRRIKAVD